MNTHKLISSRFGVRLGLFLGRILPVRIGYTLTASAAGLIGRWSSSSLVHAVMHNQWVVRNEDRSLEGLRRSAVEVLQHAGRCLIDLYHHLDNPNQIKKLLAYDDSVEQIISYSHDPNFGAFIVAPHLSNFDLCLLALAYHGLKAKVLTYGQPRGGYQIQNQLREKTGLEITPVSEGTHQQVVEYLSKGGLVITGVDRPIRKKVQRLNFFNHPSPLPVGHIRMSIEAEVPIIVASASMDNQGRYAIQISKPIHMVLHEEKEQKIRGNAERVLNVIEKRIKKHPGQWLMFYPVWPDVKIQQDGSTLSCR